jgi:3-hydroxybutyryl-CoA dehydratase
MSPTDLLGLETKTSAGSALKQNPTSKESGMDQIVGYFPENLSVGMSESIIKTITEVDIVMFAQVSGDTNPVHLDEDYAAASPFKTRIAHGMLAGSLFSAVLGTKLPGPGTIYLSQNLKFKAPVRIGETVEARVTVAEINESKKRIHLECICSVGETIVIEGDAVVMVSSKASHQ